MKASHPHPPLTPALAVNDAAAAIEFYEKAFGAEELYRLIDPENGKIGHAEILLNGSLVMLADEYPQFNKTPKTLGGTTMKLAVMTDDANALFSRTVEAGAEIVRPLTDEFYGYRSGTVRDPFGHEWAISQVIEEVSPQEMQRRWDEMAGGAKRS